MIYDTLLESSLTSNWPRLRQERKYIKLIEENSGKSKRKKIMEQLKLIANHEFKLIESCPIAADEASIIDSVGAGDAFNATIINGLSKPRTRYGDDMQIFLDAACRVGKKKIQQEGFHGLLEGAYIDHMGRRYL